MTIEMRKLLMTIQGAQCGESVLIATPATDMIEEVTRMLLIAVLPAATGPDCRRRLV